VTRPSSIWISAEQWAPSEWDPRCDAVDVVATMPDGSRWAATFLTASYMARVRDSYRESGECLDGGYFWIARPVFVDELSRPAIEAVVDDLVESGELRTAFRRLPGAVVDRAP